MAICERQKKDMISTSYQGEKQCSRIELIVPSSRGNSDRTRRLSNLSVIDLFDIAPPIHVGRGGPASYNIETRYIT